MTDIKPYDWYEFWLIDQTSNCNMWRVFENTSETVFIIYIHVKYLPDMTGIQLGKQIGSDPVSHKVTRPMALWCKWQSIDSFYLIQCSPYNKLIHVHTDRIFIFILSKVMLVSVLYCYYYCSSFLYAIALRFPYFWPRQGGNWYRF